jgi:hypothetical protein
VYTGTAVVTGQLTVEPINTQLPEELYSKSNKVATMLGVDDH